MKYVERWGLMRSTCSDNLQEHSFETALVAHALCLIDNEFFGGSLNPDRAAVYALFHDAAETITGDMPTPVKYFSEDMRETYREIENKANQKLVSMLPEGLQPAYGSIIRFEEEAPEYRVIVKAADKITAYLKCVEEEKFGNGEFSSAKKTAYNAIAALDIPCVNYFMEHFTDGYKHSLDENL